MSYKKFPFFLLSFWIVLLLSTQSAFAQNNSIAEWTKKFKEEPDKALNIFNLAVSYQKAGKNKKAIKYYKLFLKKKSKLKPVGLYYLSKTYLSMNKKELAEKTIELIDTAKLPKNFKQKVITYKNSLRIEDLVSSPKKEDRFFGNISLTYGYNSNPQFISADDTTDAVEADNQIGAILNMSYLAALGKSYDFSIRYGGSALNFSDSTASNYSYQNLSTPINFYSSKYRLQISPIYSYQTYSGEAFNQILSGLIELKRKFSAGYFSIGYNFDSIDSLNDTFSYLEGSTSGPYLQWQQSWIRTHWYLTYTFQDNSFQDSTTISPSFVANSINSTLMQQLTNWNWALTLGLQNREYTYDVTEADTRKDQRVWAQLSLAYILNRQWSILLNTAFFKNDSNFDQNNTDDKNYDQLSVSSGLRWNF